MTIKLVILAAGRGSRMRQEVPGAVLSPEQREMAGLGLKGLIPFHGRPYLDYVITAAADAGLRDICLVVRPGPNPLRRHYERVATERVRIGFAVQDEPRGSASALLAAEDFAAGEPVLVINSDNYYPTPALARLRAVDGSGMVGFDERVLSSRGNIPAGRGAAYAVAMSDQAGFLSGITEKPSAVDAVHGHVGPIFTPAAGAPAAEALRGPSVPRGGGARPQQHRGDSRQPQERNRDPRNRTPDGRLGLGYVSMNCWKFGPSIFAACRQVPRSVRGEHELPDAVLWAMRSFGERFRIVPVDEPVLDLSSQGDIASVEGWLEGKEARL